MVSTASTQKKPPPRLSTKDYLIRTKALDLLSQATPDHQIVYENNSDDDDDEYSHFSWITPISSYQNSRSVSAMERQKCEPVRIAPTQDQWIDIFVPAVSCISNACKEGILSMVKQTTDGFQEIRNDLRDRRQYQVSVKEEEILYPSHQPRYTKSLPPKVQGTSDHRGTQKKRLAAAVAAAGQPTAERHYATTTAAPAARQAFREEDILCYNPSEWRPSGSLFVPVEEIRQYQYDDVSAMTDDGSGATLRSTTTSKKCLFAFCPV